MVMTRQKTSRDVDVSVDQGLESETVEETDEVIEAEQDQQEDVAEDAESELDIGEESFWVSVQADITARKRSEAELSQYRGQLEKLVEENYGKKTINISTSQQQLVIWYPLNGR